MASLSTQGNDALQALTQLPAGEAKAVVDTAAEANPGLIPGGDVGKIVLWCVLLTGVFIIAIIALLGAIQGDPARDAAPLYVITTAVVSGALGLFAKSPTAK